MHVKLSEMFWTITEPHRVPCNYPLGNEAFPSLKVERAELRESGLNDLNYVIPFHLKNDGKLEEEIGYWLRCE